MPYVHNLFDSNFLEYASYVIKDRAIPHIDDGLKPVQRRILHSLFEMDDGKFHKVANVVGHCMKYHPHGDASINDALVALAAKELFIDTQGNFGNIFTGDQASAARYIECRVRPFAKEVLYNPKITEYEDSYDGRNREPKVFPAKIPVVLIQGAEGIAVGMATKILPHNLVEVLAAVKAALVGEYRPLYPDFPTGGLVDVTDYDDGNGRVLVRAALDVSDPKRIVIRELPFGSTTESLTASIEAAARKGKIKIAGINDFTTDKVEIEIQLARGVYATDVVDSLYAFTDCEQSISVNLLLISRKNPVQMAVREVIAYHATRLVDVLRAELKLEEGELRDRLHARTLERIFIEERIYKRIEEMTTNDAVIAAVIDGFVPFAAQIKREVTRDDVETLLRIPIRRISLYDINRARAEMEQIKARLKEIKERLAAITEYAVSTLDALTAAMAADHPRRTTITSFTKVDARVVSKRELPLRYDEQNGYLGYGISTGSVLFAVSEFDRVLVIKKNGNYAVVPVPEKLFVGPGMLLCGLAAKESLSGRVFSILYRDNVTKYVYLKRCRIEQFILEKSYELLPENTTILKLTTREDVRITLTYKPKKGLKKTEDTFDVGAYLIKGVRAAGVRLANKEIKSFKVAVIKAP